MKQETFNKLDKLIEEGKFSGVIYITRNDEVLYKNSGGFRDISNKLTNNLHTKFALASGAKTFTSIAVLLLHEQGLLNLNDKISKYIGNLFPNYDNNVTIKHLLTHTSGIPDYLDEDKDEDLSHVPWSKLLKPKDYFTYFPKTEMDFEPGSKFKYNNGAFVLLAHIVDEITGDFYQFVHDYIKKIGLKDTGYYMFNQLPENTANGYIFSEDGSYKTNIYDLPIIGSGDGGIYSTVFDIHSLWINLFKGNLLNQETVKNFIEPQINVNNNNHYGLGAWIRKSEELHTVDMLGQDQGVSYLSSYNVKTKEIYTVISNNDRDAWKVLKTIEE